MLKFSELAWAAYIYTVVTQGDKVYWEVEQSRGSIDDLVRSPTSSKVKEIESVVVGQFLNRWGRCRIPNKKTWRIAAEMVKKLNGLEATELDSLSTLSIGDVGAGRLSTDCAGGVVKLYDDCCSIDGCGPTVVSKILFVLFPKLFVMWDGAIRDHLKMKTGESRIRTDDGEGYLAYLRLMGQMAKSVSDNFRDTLGQTGRSEDYLSCRLYAKGKTKTLAKYLDEYGWIKITNIGAIVEQDRPSDLFPPPQWLTALAYP